MRTFTRPLLALALPAMLVVAACSGSGSSAAPSAAAATVAPSVAAPSEAAEPSAEASEAAGGGAIVLVDSALGKIIVDGDESGKTVYAFTPDSAGTPTCYDDCAANWPPVTPEDAAPAVGAGLDASLLTVVDRTDGTKQLKYGDWPLYYFAGDSAAGDTNGQGVGTKWYVIGADGKLIGQ
jgi:predicted lipoprotein with Yx(FWY)xxD motif